MPLKMIAIDISFVKEKEILMNDQTNELANKFLINTTGLLVAIISAEN